MKWALKTFFQNDTSKSRFDAKELERLTKISNMIKQSEENIKELETLNKKYDDSIQKKETPKKIQNKKEVVEAIENLKQITADQKAILAKDSLNFFKHSFNMPTRQNDPIEPAQTGQNRPSL